MRKPTYSTSGKAGVMDVLKEGKSGSGSKYGGSASPDPAPVELKRRVVRGRGDCRCLGICGREMGRSEESYGVLVQLGPCQCWGGKPTPVVKQLVAEVPPAPAASSADRLSQRGSSGPPSRPALLTGGAAKKVIRKSWFPPADVGGFLLGLSLGYRDFFSFFLLARGGSVMGYSVGRVNGRTPRGSSDHKSWPKSPGGQSIILGIPNGREDLCPFPLFLPIMINHNKIEQEIFPRKHAGLSFLLLGWKNTRSGTLIPQLTARGKEKKRLTIVRQYKKKEEKEPAPIDD